MAFIGTEADPYGRKNFGEKLRKKISNVDKAESKFFSKNSEKNFGQSFSRTTPTKLGEKLHFTIADTHSIRVKIYEKIVLECDYRISLSRWRVNR
jgi:hypothetical protein